MEKLGDFDRLLAWWKSRGGNGLGVDGAKMINSARNAAIFYVQDSFDPVAKGINGRRVAGESFLRGFLTHAEVDEFVILSHSTAEEVQRLTTQLRPDIPLRQVPLLRPQSMQPLGTVFYPSPNFAAEAWRRAAYGTGAWSICGITHTTSTAAVMQGFFDLRMAPVQAWDAVICTSKAVLASVTHLADLADGHIRSHLRGTPPPRPLFPVIPLGIHSSDFEPDAAAGAGLRAQLGAGPQDVVFTTIARLTPHEKFDPLPIYLAMQAAQRALPDRKLHIAFCGQFREAYSRKVFTEGAAKMMPDVGFVLLDGGDAAARKAALSGADVFMFLIDNIQETFGLAPLEGMAAGLPLLVSDWDGMKDTVTDDVGFRITSRMLPASHTAQEALRYQGGSDNYVQYCSTTSALTELDMAEMTARILQLARNPDLRRKMGAAGRARVRSTFDWAQIVPQMQDLWAEQAAIRTAHTAQAKRYRHDALPIAPAPSNVFAAYPTEQASFANLRLFAVLDPARPSLPQALAARDYAGLKRIFAAPDQIAKVLQAAVAAKDAGVVMQDLVDATGLAPLSIDRILIWLLKYGFLRRG